MVEGGISKFCGSSVLKKENWYSTTWWIYVEFLISLRKISLCNTESVICALMEGWILTRTAHKDSRLPYSVGHKWVLKYHKPIVGPLTGHFSIAIECARKHITLQIRWWGGIESFFTKTSPILGEVNKEGVRSIRDSEQGILME